jgi:tetratricopeptide (TPR) repeat protein
MPSRSSAPRLTLGLLILAWFAAWTAPVTAAPSTAAPAQARFEELNGESRSAMLSNPAKALGFAQQAAKAATAITTERERQLAQSQAHWLEAEALNRTGKVDEANRVAGDALRLVEQIDAGSKLNGDLLATIGQITRAKGDVVAALGLYQRAFQIFEAKGERRSQAKVLQYIGTLYFDAGDFERTLKYYADSAELFDDPAIRLGARTNQAGALIELKRYDEAIAQYRQALDIARSMDSDDFVTIIITNLAYAQLSAGNVAAAQKLVSQGMASRGAQDPERAEFLRGVQAGIDWA